MSSSSTDSERFKVLIAGGGVAGIEACLALRDLAGDRVDLTLLTPSAEFVYRPMTVREPFALALAQRVALEQIAADVGAELVHDAVSNVEIGSDLIHTKSGAEIRYDALMLGLGAEIRARYKHAITIDDRQLDEQLHGLIQDVEGGYVKRIAFVASTPMAWPLPLYELALLTASRAYDMNVELAVMILTPEHAPLGVFGDQASRAVAELLANHRIEVITSAHCEIPRNGWIEIAPGDRGLAVDRVVALPELHGPAVPGLPDPGNGFIPVDEHCQVRGAERVYAAGDATDFMIKFGGIAAQQADTAAQSIAALAGAPVEPQPFHPVIEAVLLTGDQPLRFNAHITDGYGFGSEVATISAQDAPAKIAAKYLTPYLESRA